MKQFRIYRSRASSDFSNTYLQYFDSLKDAKKAARKKDKWECQAVCIEQYNLEKNNWRPIHA
jgi:hypothetical protein